MATARELPPFPKFELNSELSTIGIRWKKWIKRFENLTLALDIKDATRKRALLLHYAGEEVYDVFDTLPDTGEENEYRTAVDKLTEYFTPKKNVEYEIYMFRQAKQEPKESIATYHTRLRQLAATCEFTNVDREIKTQIVQNCTSSRLRRRALREPGMTLTTLLDTAKALELSEAQASGIEHATNNYETVNAIKPRKRYPDKKSQGRQHRNTKCRYCGGEYPHKDGAKSCPARGKTCNNCGKANHFAKVCRSRPKQDQATTTKRNEKKNPTRAVNTVKIDPSSSDDEYIYSVYMCDTKVRHQSQPKATVVLSGTPVQFLVDTGASVNLIDRSTFEKLNNKPMYEETNTSVYPYGSKKPLPILGKFSTDVHSKSSKTHARFFVVNGNSGSLLSYETACALNLIEITNAISQVSTVKKTTSDGKIDKLINEYSDIFQGLGKLKDTQVKLHIDSSVQPVTQPHRRVPFHIRKKVEEEITKLEELDIIEKVEGPTPWVSPIVAAPKPKNPDKVRICVDMRLPNQAIKRERHTTPTIDEILYDINGAKVFSKLDLNSGYHQLELAPESRYITTFSTHLGLRRYKRLNFGVTSAAEVFQNHIEQTLQGLPGVRNISDDIIVTGTDEENHYEHLKAVFKRIRDKNLTLNAEKCIFNKSSLEYYGNIFSADGVSPDPKKVLAIQNASPPTNQSEVKSLLGMASYCSRFIPDFATITHPLRELTKKDVRWKWSEAHQNALDALKRELSSDTVMCYYDPSKQTELIADASPVGLGAILTQKDTLESPARIVAYASKALTPVEQRYSQTEREALALVWACEHFHLYLYGNSFTMVTDHKPLEAILGNPRSKPTARIERWNLRLQPYDYKIVYRAGKDNPADYISRHPGRSQEEPSSRATKVSEEYIQFVTENAVPKAMTLLQVQEATKADPTLQKVTEYIRSGKWKHVPKDHSNKVNSEALIAFSKVHKELTVTSEHGIILRGTRIVVPESLQAHAISLAHEGHQGIVKTKRLLREKVWFPNIDRQVEVAIANCIPCQASIGKNQSEPLRMTKLPEEPWLKVDVDFCGPFPSGDYLLVVIDEYSRYPEVEIVKSTSARAVIPKLDKIFASLGIPQELKSDNGPPFTSHEFKSFSQYMGFKHRKITPYWPKANGEAESFMKSVGKTVKTAHAEGKPWKQELYKFLRNYRATPHSSTKVPPSSLIYRRMPRIKLPEVRKRMTDRKVRKADSEAKRKMKFYSDVRTNAQNSEMKIGDTVLVKQRKEGKLSTPFNTKPYQVVNKKGTMVTAQRDMHTITRNVSQFKLLKGEVTKSEDAELADLDEPIQPQEEMQEDEKPESSPPAERRYPQRQNRRPPAYLKDFVV